METLAFIVIGCVVGLARSDVFYGRPHSAQTYPVVPQVYGDKYYSRDGIRDDYYGGDLLRKDVHAAQQSGLQSAKDVGGKHLVRANTAGGDAYLGTSGVRELAAYDGANAGGLEKYGKSGNGAYQAYGNGGFKKGHSSSGFHKAYNNVESGKDSSFIDHELKEGGEQFENGLGGFHGAAVESDWKKGAREGAAEHAAGADELAQSGVHSIGEHVNKFAEDGRLGKYDRQHLLSNRQNAGGLRRDHLADSYQYSPFYHY